MANRGNLFHHCLARPVRYLAFILLLGIADYAHPADNGHLQTFSNWTQTRTLRQFGAIGDGKTDDTAPVKRALAQSEKYCLDGENRTYKVVGTLRITTNFCLKRTVLKQAAVPVDTRPYITKLCPEARDAFTVSDCGNKPIPEEKLTALRHSLAIRTLLIRPDREGRPSLRILLDNVTVDRGQYPESGSRQDSAGIWLEGANRVDFRNVEITGFGKGYGLLLIRSKNVNLDNLNVHDIIWAPYEGDAPLNRVKTETIGWNAIPIQEFRAVGEDGVDQNKFYGVRIQEQVTCVYLAEVENVVVTNAKVSRCLARFDTVDMPWQTDGLDIGRSSRNILVASTRINSTWEGIDVVAGGSGVSDLALQDVTVSNSFSFGLKLGYRLSNARITGSKIERAGLAGIVIYGPVKNVSLTKATITNMGSVTVQNMRMTPWERYTRAGIRLDEGSPGTGVDKLTPDRVVIRDAIVASAAHQADYDYGYLNAGGTNTHLSNGKANGFRKGLSSGFQSVR